ncbi:hypothetical protein HQO38_20435 [Rhodococcus fascians]|uniref:hypothetical protein n=1 Tax=Rhodococcoides fascians TaxID=1828 RepID=UPI00195FF899|nr:hypothetical protein [Rhodococcus fascians]MBM7245186.1 hypothetical protein [Rhodococcus fascians]MBY3811065.1 hypothetical protein [Rhodococcus fascians]MBY3842568.1 hypothetical protein [Rhodococcus fascians]MBY3845477.1 hypothetical protein [Rhodococcus fascians]MBY3851791.1 hypothetical protein [Rhodococcus fascians]
MTVTGLPLPQISLFDPPVAGEGSLDPLGLSIISERLADRLVPGLRARMSRFRFLTAIAIASAVCEDFVDERASDERTTPQVAFEWLVLESFAHRSSEIPVGVPGMQKARAVRDKKDRLSANSYLKAPSIFGFHGVYKPLAIEFDIITPTLRPGKRQQEVIAAWENDNAHTGFLDRSPGTVGGRLRSDLEATLKRTLAKSRSDLPLTGLSSETLAWALEPDSAGSRECAVIRRALGDKHPLRAELAHLVLPTLESDDDLPESDIVARTRERASASLAELLDAVAAYEKFVRTLDVVFRTLRHIASTSGSTPITPRFVENHPNITRASAELPSLYSTAIDRLQPIGSEAAEFDARFAVFSSPLSPSDVAQTVLDHHNAVQRSKPPQGKRPWFEPYRDGLLVRPGYEHSLPPSYDGPFIHPIRIHALRRFLWDTAL